MRTIPLLAASLVLAISLHAPPGQASWPGWRGPAHDGTSADPTPLAPTFPDGGPPQLWQSPPIPSDHDGGHGSPIIADDKVFLSLVWHERVPSRSRILDDETLGALGYRSTRQLGEQLVAEMEEARTSRPNLRGARLDAWIDAWVAEKLDEEAQLSLGSWVASRLRQGQEATPVSVLETLDSRRDQPFDSHADLVAWLAAEIPEKFHGEILQKIPDTIKVAQDVVICLDLHSGKERWRFSAEGEPTGRQSSSTPATADGRIVAIGSRSVRALDTKDGKLLWEVPFKPRAIASSPLIHDGAAYLALGQLHAFDLDSGEERWAQPLVNNSQSSPSLTSIDGQPVILATGRDGVLGIRPADGEPLWTVPGGGQPTPVSDGTHLVVFGKDKGLRAYRLGAKAEDEPQLLWEKNWITRRYQSSPLIHQGHVYLLGSGRHLCVDLATGEERWSAARESSITSPILADGKLIVVENNGSDLVLIEADPAAYKPLSSHKPRALWCPTPALSQGHLILRTKEHLVCFDLRDPAPRP